MTVLTKLKTTMKKCSPLKSQRDELVIDVNQPACESEHTGGGGKWQETPTVLFSMFMAILMLALIGFLAVRQIYEQVNRPPMRYHGYCSIPIPTDIQMTESRKMALRWQDAVHAMPHEASDKMQVVTIGKLNMDEADLPAEILNELLDINVDDSLERIAVFRNGHAVSFLHDFESNVTGIVDSERCFVMDMSAESALEPQLFVVGLQQGGEFDVGLVRSRLRALLPPDGSVRAAATAAAARGMADRCRDKPVYQLQTDNNTVIRKRAADEPQHDYILFAGKNVQQIEISNLPDLLHYEQAHKQPV